MKPIIMHRHDNIIEWDRSGFFPKALSMSADQNAIISALINPRGNTGLLLILSHKKEMRKDIIIHPTE
ncbi:MAG: hypothetical protein QXR45_09150 [Candidatus Bathyarchaeia archaeon]